MPLCCSRTARSIACASPRSAAWGQNGVITRQTYAEGVLLESSNAETWTPLNGSDLAMRVYGYDFQNSGTIQFQPISGQQFSDLNIDEYSAVPDGCGILWEYSTDGGATHARNSRVR